MEKTTMYNKVSPVTKSYLAILLTVFLALFLTNSYALPFNIIPNGVLPQTVARGSTVTASYIVTNSTSAQRNNNFVKYLPPNVSLGSGGCANNFNLAPNGQPGDHCILNLIISGPVDAQDPNPHHHLFVCFPKGTTCAGTLFPLNVFETPALASLAILPINSNIRIGGTQQFQAISTDQNGSTQNVTSQVIWHSSNPVAPISSTGLVTGLNFGTTFITATLGALTSNTATLTVRANIVSVGTFFNGSSNSPLSYFSVDGGNSWTRSAVLPPPLGDTTLPSVACDSIGINCVAVGGIDNLAPVAYFTMDGGNTWILPTVLPPPQGSSDVLNAVACDSTGKKCTAVGQYFIGTFLPLAYFTLDGGHTWIVSSTLPPPQGTDNLLQGVACDTTGQKCTAVGTYFNGANNLPISYLTLDGGNTWTVSTTPPPPQPGNTVLNSVACDSTGQKCTTVGQLSVGTGVPVSYITSDGGNNWALSAITPPLQGTGDVVDGVACDSTGQTCVAVGFSSFIAVGTTIGFFSSDGGNTWSVSSTLQQPGSSQFLRSVTCDPTGKNCTAVGNFVAFFGAPSTPLSYYTTDGGFSWTLSANQPIPNGSQDFLIGVA